MKQVNSDLIHFMGVPIDVIPMGKLNYRIADMMDSESRPQVMACANPHSLAVSKSNNEFYWALNNAEVVIADGAGVCLFASKLKKVKVERITGADFFMSTMSILEKRAGKVFFFGSSERVLEIIRKKLEKEYENIQLVGMISPPFGEWSKESDMQFIEQINSAKPDVLWVGMTAPKQEVWVNNNKDALDVPLIGNIGAVFDFYAGTYNRAPAWMCKRNLEWAYRLFKEPRRMWRRNFISTPLFIKEVLVEHFRGN